ncbi:hypothetical protein G4X40_04235 [Rhodococcus sp. D2-41]|uniref:Uncharacterized protein n=1 Tax=Speluncibacter jeojiensis TaxID=2710754 RepID=A0A9X4RG92_9ACTN|nr:hypothetical protein [Rhodococcus sp. D2-41]MDG3009353.1 hypothetical protein [Rhodococcus sp. D2-41]MDG3017092.1 hypothetical protein [Corynebacteriales bacterium D3-21]
MNRPLTAVITATMALVGVAAVAVVSYPLINQEVHPDNSGVRTAVVAAPAATLDAPPAATTATSALTSAATAGSDVDTNSPAFTQAVDKWALGPNAGSYFTAVSTVLPLNTSDQIENAAAAAILVCTMNAHGGSGQVDTQLVDTFTSNWHHPITLSDAAAINTDAQPICADQPGS